MKKLKGLMSVVSVVWAFFLLIAFTFTWVARNWTPSFEQNEIQISTAGALVISLTGDDNHDVVSLNEVVQLDSFVFKQVSSQDGETFFWKDFTPTLNDEPAVYKKVTDLQKENYIDTEFALKLDDSLTEPKYIFIHPDSILSSENIGISSDVAKAIRISLQYEDIDENGQPVKYSYILGNTEDKDEPDYSTSAVLPDADGKNDKDETATNQQKVYNLRYFNAGWDNYTNGQTDHNFTVEPSRTLFKLNPGGIRWIKMRIWLEGADENCVNEIAGQSFDMVLKFDSISVSQ
ncbi:MAG: hypothetical protein E7384_03800 [Ruminococcaceae bacterium]|nr:hypothetical protein [Oscillospiraceae bacterium]